MQDKFIKSLIYSLLGCILVLILMLQPYNLYCRFLSNCQPIFLSEFLPSKIGKKEIIVNFDSRVSDKISKLISFKPQKSLEKIISGQRVKNIYIIENLGNQTLKIKTKFQIKPQEADKYLSKIQCLCFRQIIVNPGQKLEVPVNFKIGSKIEKDANIALLKEVTISYEADLAD